MATPISGQHGRPLRRPGGRSARVGAAVYAAVGELVSEGRRDEMTVQDIAERAGVNPTSIYRRWGSLENLLGEVAVAALTTDEPLPDTGTIRGDLDEWARVIAADIARPERVIYLRAMVGARRGLVEACPCWSIRTEQAAEMAARSRERGEQPPTPTQILDHVVAPLYHHVVFGLPVDASYAHRLVEDVLVIRPS